MQGLPLTFGLAVGSSICCDRPDCGVWPDTMGSRSGTSSSSTPSQLQLTRRCSTDCLRVRKPDTCFTPSAKDIQRRLQHRYQPRAPGRLVATASVAKMQTNPGRSSPQTHQHLPEHPSEHASDPLQQPCLRLYQMSAQLSISKPSLSHQWLLLPSLSQRRKPFWWSKTWSQTKLQVGSLPRPF